MSHTKEFRVYESAPFSGVDPQKINREQGYIDGVLICGTSSRNGRDYPADVFRRDFKVYEGVHVRCDHDDNRVTDKKIGWFSGVYVDDAGRPRGRLNLLKSHPMTERVYEAAERNPSLYGMSHVAVCGTKRVTGRERVESLNKAHSIDLVDDPATLKSLYESFQPQRPPMLFKAFAEQVAAKWSSHRPALVKFLREEMGEMEMPEAPDMSAPVADDPVKAAFSQAMHALVDQFDGGGIDGPGLIAKLKSLMKAAEKMSDSPEPKEPTGDKPDAEMESLKATLADAIRENAELKLNTLIGDTKLTDVQRKAVGLLSDEADRKALVESFRQIKQSQAPKSGEQNGQKKHTESTAVPTDGAKFAEFIR